jgi:hypothetical protein
VDTAERTATHQAPTVYDGFISYSHAADGLLAPRLQSGLQRFAKPWWKRRALRVFRDESSLSANPHLWSSITEALDESDWFVLLLSPDAAQSPWVNQEIEYWLEHKDPSRILPVVTDGRFGWDGDVTGDAAPEALRGVFLEEPRWVELRFARDEEQLDLKNPRFSSAVADIASALRGVPKDELESEEVKQHRRTVHTAWAAGALVGVLAIAATVFGIQSANNAREAETQRLAAETEAERANAEADRADANAREAEDQRRLADQRADEAKQREQQAIAQAGIAESRRLAMAATLAIETDPELGMLLALEAQKVTSDELTPIEALAPMREAIEAHSLLWRFSVPSNRFNSAVLAPDAATVYYTSGGDNALRAVDVASREILWEYAAAGGSSKLREVRVSPDGRLISLSVAGTAEQPARILIFEPHSETPESPVEVLESEGCRRMSTAPGGFSEQGEYFTATTGTVECGPTNPGADWAVAYNTSSWAEVFVYSAEGFTSESIQIVESASRGLLRRESPTEPGFRVVEVPGWDLIEDFEGAGYATASPTGQVVFDPSPDSSCACTPSRLRVTDSDLNTLATLAPDIQMDERQGSIVVADPASFSPDGTLIATVTQLEDWIFDATDGSRFKRIPSNQPTLEHSWSSDSTKLLTTHEDALLLWAVRPDAGLLGRISGATDIASLAMELLTRGFTAGECETHDIDPCPTLEEMREG